MKWIGAIIILAGCSYLGLYTAALLHAEVKSLRKIISVLDFMSCELQYKLTPLPELCRKAAKETSGRIERLLACFANELDSQISPDVKSCMCAAISQVSNLPESTRKCMMQLGASMGRFDLTGQVQALEAVRASCRNQLEALEEGKDSRLRTYKTLGLCAGAAMVILFV